MVSHKSPDLSIYIPISLGSDVKSRKGTGIFFTIYSQTTSMLYFSCAEIGIIGAPSATVPKTKSSSTSSFNIVFTAI